MNMDIVAGGLESEDSFPPPLSRPGKPESGSEQPYCTDQRLKLSVWDEPTDSADSHGSTSMSTSSDELETDRNGDNCEKMIERWRLIRLADKDRPKKKKVAHLKVDVLKRS